MPDIVDWDKKGEPKKTMQPAAVEAAVAATDQSITDLQKTLEAIGNRDMSPSLSLRPLSDEERAKRAALNDARREQFGLAKGAIKKPESGDAPNDDSTEKAV